MYYINRIGYISQELAYLCRLLIRSSTRRPQPHKKRKNHNYTKSFINTIHANRLQSFQIRNREQRNQYNSTYPKRPIHLHRLEVTRLPVVLDGTTTMIGRNGMFNWRNKLTVSILPPVSAERVAAADPKELMEQVRASMCVRLAEIRKQK